MKPRHTHDSSLVFEDRGQVIFATRGAESPSFSETIDYSRAQGRVCWPEPAVGGWGLFIRTELKKQAHPNSRKSGANEPRGDKQQLKKGGRGWLHRR
jgi:hypothetical protein